MALKQKLSPNAVFLNENWKNISTCSEKTEKKRLGKVTEIHPDKFCLKFKKKKNSNFQA